MRNAFLEYSISQLIHNQADACGKNRSYLENGLNTLWEESQGLTVLQIKNFS